MKAILELDTKEALAKLHEFGDEAQRVLEGLTQLRKQQLEEIEQVSKTFDYSRFAGVTGPLSDSFFKGSEGGYVPPSKVCIRPAVTLSHEEALKALDNPKTHARIVDILTRNAKRYDVKGPLLNGSNKPEGITAAKSAAAKHLHSLGYSLAHIGRVLSVSKTHAWRLVKGVK